MTIDLTKESEFTALVGLIEKGLVEADPIAQLHKLRELFLVVEVLSVENRALRERVERAERERDEERRLADVRGEMLTKAEEALDACRRESSIYMNHYAYASKERDAAIQRARVPEEVRELILAGLDEWYRRYHYRHDALHRTRDARAWLDSLGDEAEPATDDEIEPVRFDPRPWRDLMEVVHANLDALDARIGDDAARIEAVKIARGMRSRCFDLHLWIERLERRLERATRVINGTGKEPTKPCSRCDGTGRGPDLLCKPPKSTVCAACDGTGKEPING